MKMTLTLEDKDLLGLSEGAMVALFRTIHAIANENNDNSTEPKKPAPTIENNVSNESKTVSNEEKPKAKEVTTTAEEPKAKEITTTAEEPKQRSRRKSNNTKKELKVEEEVTEKTITDEPITNKPEIKQPPTENKNIETEITDESTTYEETPTMTMDELKHFCATNCKAHVGLSAKLRKVLTDEFKAEKLSSVKPEDYQKLHDRVTELVEGM